MPGGCEGVLALGFADRAYGIRAGSVDHGEDAGVGFFVDAGCAGDRADLRLVGLDAHELIEQGGLAHVGRADNGDLAAFAECCFELDYCQVD